MAGNENPARGQRPDPQGLSFGDAKNIIQNAPATQVRILEFKPVKRNSLRGYFDLELASGIIFRGCTLQYSHNKFWVGLPAKPYQSTAGKASWARIIDFRDRQTADRFQKIATAAAVSAFEQIQARGAA